jgi:hypothetical protein
MRSLCSTAPTPTRGTAWPGPAAGARVTLICARRKHRNSNRARRRFTSRVPQLYQGLPLVVLDAEGATVLAARVSNRAHPRRPALACAGSRSVRGEASRPG